MAIAQVAQTQERPIDQEGDFLKINAMDHVEFWVGNAKQAAHYWRTAFGFRQIAYSGLETANRRCASYVMEQGKIRFVLSTPYSPHDEMAAHHLLHGDGVKVAALEVNDVEQAWRETTAALQEALEQERRIHTTVVTDPEFLATKNPCVLF